MQLTSTNLIIFLILVLVAGFLLGFYVNWNKVQELRPKAEKYDAQQEVLRTYTAPPGQATQIDKKVLDLFTAPNR